MIGRLPTAAGIEGGPVQNDAVVVDVENRGLPLAKSRIEEIESLGVLMRGLVHALPWAATAAAAVAACVGIKVFAAGYNGSKIPVEAIHQRYAGGDVDARNIRIGDVVEVLDHGAQGVSVWRRRGRCALHAGHRRQARPPSTG